MSVPGFQNLMRPLLEMVANNDTATLTQLAPMVASALALSDEDLAETLGNTRRSTFRNRLAWAKIYLGVANLIETVRPDEFRITERGQSLLCRTSNPITLSTLQQFPEYVAWRKGKNSKSRKSENSNGTHIDGSTPEEQIETATKSVEVAIRTELLDKFRKSSPAFFERVVIDLLQAMGFANRIGAQSFVTGKSGDGGVDGVVHQDALGLDAIYVQAKRYAEGNVVGRPAIQAFVGSMVGFSASKGVFVTTSHFSTDARAYLGKVQQRVVLIDGERLAELALAYNIGTRVQSTIELKAIDEAYFEDDISIDPA